MARTGIGVTGISKAGADAPEPVAGDPVNGNQVPNPDGATILLAGNTGALTRTLSIRIVATVDGQPAGPRVISVPAGQTLLLGPYPRWWYGPVLLLDPDHADLTISALRLGSDLPAPGAGSGPAPFSLSGLVVVADLDAAGLSADGAVLVADTALTGSTVDGDVLVVTV